MTPAHATLSLLSAGIPGSPISCMMIVRTMPTQLQIPASTTGLCLLQGQMQSFWAVCHRHSPFQISWLRWKNGFANILTHWLAKLALTELFDFPSEDSCLHHPIRQKILTKIK